MTDPITMPILANATVAFLAHHTPWLADKLGGAVLSQTVRETRETVKRKLSSTPEGEQALNHLVTQPSAPAETLTTPLLNALQSDPDFAAQLSRLIVTGSDNQIAQGDHIKQAKVTGSSVVSINIS
jgi:hypothetical protein